MSFTVNKDVLEKHVNNEMDELESMGSWCVEGKFALHTEEGYQVQIVVTKEEDEFCDPENDYTREAKAS